MFLKLNVLLVLLLQATAELRVVFTTPAQQLKNLPMVALNVVQTQKPKCATTIVDMIASGDLGPTMAASFLVVLPNLVLS
jgi:hypothetical protein